MIVIGAIEEPTLMGQIWENSVSTRESVKLSFIIGRASAGSLESTIYATVINFVPDRRKR